MIVSELALRMSPGKRMHSATYLHVSALEYAHPELVRMYEKAVKVLREEAEIDGHEAQVIKFHRGVPRVSLMWLGGDFEAVGHPEILFSVLVDAATGEVKTKSYVKSDNPPVIHRKEDMLSREHPRWAEFRRLTIAEECASLMGNPPGFRRQWEKLLARKGYRVEGNRLVKLRVR